MRERCPGLCCCMSWGTLFTTTFFIIVVKRWNKLAFAFVNIMYMQNIVSMPNFQSKKKILSQQSFLIQGHCIPKFYNRPFTPLFHALFRLMSYRANLGTRIAWFWFVLKQKQNKIHWCLGWHQTPSPVLWTNTMSAIKPDPKKQMCLHEYTETILIHSYGLIIWKSSSSLQCRWRKKQRNVWKVTNVRKKERQKVKPVFNRGNRFGGLTLA